MDAFGDRPRRRLVATGETVRKRSAGTRDELTPQEEQIVRLARDGLSNPEISSQIFITARTVEWHLCKEFTKLGIRTRSRQCRPWCVARADTGRGSEVPGHSRHQGLDARLRARHPGAVSPRSRESRRTRSQLPARMLPEALDES